VALASIGAKNGRKTGTKLPTVVIDAEKASRSKFFKLKINLLFCDTFIKDL
jgi:hypothetical protein